LAGEREVYLRIGNRASIWVHLIERSSGPRGELERQIGRTTPLSSLQLGLSASGWQMFKTETNVGGGLINGRGNSLLTTEGGGDPF